MVECLGGTDAICALFGGGGGLNSLQLYIGRARNSQVNSAKDEGVFRLLFVYLPPLPFPDPSLTDYAPLYHLRAVVELVSMAATPVRTSRPQSVPFVNLFTLLPQSLFCINSELFCPRKRERS